MNRFTDLFGKLLELIDVNVIEEIGIEALLATIIVLVAWWISRLLQRFIERRMRHGELDDESFIHTYKRVAWVIVMVPGILLAVHVFGIDLSSIFTTGGLFAVALAFATKNVVENYIAGMMLRFEGTIKPGDVLEFEGKTARVVSIGFRATIAKTRDATNFVIPNSQLIQNRMQHYKYRDSVCRIETTVGIAYSSDLKEVRKVLESVCTQFDLTSPQHKPAVLLSGFGDSAVDFTIRIWIDDPWDAVLRRSLLNEAIWWGFKERTLRSRTRNSTCTSARPSALNPPKVHSVFPEQSSR